MGTRAGQSCDELCRRRERADSYLSRRNMELQELVRRVTLLQACVRGRQVRRRLQSLRAEYEEVVRQVEGDDLGGQLRWVGRWLPRPVFSPDTRRRTFAPRAGGDSSLGPVREPPSRLQDEEPERDQGWKEQPKVKSGQEEGPGPQLEGGDRMLTRNPGSQELTLPSQPAQLQRLQRHLAMEMLWLQQAIVSRKKYLLLRQTLDLPD
ncbi:IQ domain-containing protein C [Monodelphis domestica]|uniref:IQ domain-containing protein C n=1 Tax=Monodelphis domestica TaxID=13616 RepID=UPI0004435C02|nr:IQ domain-containing protein C [Monodelphis domestica]